MNIQRIPVGQLNPAKYNPRVDLKPEDPSYIQIKKHPDIWLRAAVGME